MCGTGNRFYKRKQKIKIKLTDSYRRFKNLPYYFLTHHIIFDKVVLFLTLAKSETKLKIIDRSTDLRRTVYHEKSSIKYNKLSFDMEFPEIFGA